MTVDMGTWYLPIVSPASAQLGSAAGIIQCSDSVSPVARYGAQEEVLTGLGHDVMQTTVLQGSGNFRWFMEQIDKLEFYNFLYNSQFSLCLMNRRMRSKFE